jgi:hypothetical protein
MILLPRTRNGWLALVVVLLLAVAIGQLVSARWGVFSGLVLGLVVGSLTIVTVEAWMADTWRGTQPPAQIPPGQTIDYLVWRLRHRRPGA